MLSVLVGMEVGLVDLTDVSSFTGTFVSNEGQMVKFTSSEFHGKVGAHIEGAITVGGERALLRGVVLDRQSEEISIWATELEISSIQEREPRFRSTHVRAALYHDGKIEPVVLENASKSGAGIATPIELQVDHKVTLVIWPDGAEIQADFQIRWFGRALQAPSGKYGLLISDEDPEVREQWAKFVTKLH